MCKSNVFPIQCFIMFKENSCENPNNFILFQLEWNHLAQIEIKSKEIYFMEYNFHTKMTYILKSNEIVSFALHFILLVRIRLIKHIYIFLLIDRKYGNRSNFELHLNFTEFSHLRYRTPFLENNISFVRISISKRFTITFRV